LMLLQTVTLWAKSRSRCCEIGDKAGLSHSITHNLN
jgi:hypothetical protein